MIRFWPRFCSLAVLVSIISFSSRSAFAAPHDAEAAKLRQAAIYQDYLATDFAGAQKKLTQALTLCEKPTDCTPATRARLHCDLGVVFFASQNAADGRAQFAAALQEDPTVTLDADLSSPELQKEFDAIKSGGEAPAAGGPPAGGPGNAGPAAAAAAPAPTPGSVAESDAGVANAGRSQEETASAPNPKPVPRTSAVESDCPPGFPGCKSSEEGGETCSNDDDCESGEKCVDEVCRSEKREVPAGKRNWVSLAFQLDVPLLPAKNNVCLGGQGYSCFNTDGSWYAQAPVAGGGGDIQSAGLQVGTKRILAGFDHAFFNNLTLGGALGFAFGGGPTRQGGKPFFPVQIEARGKYWIGHHPLGRKGLRFYLMAEGGMAEVAASIQTFVYASTTSSPTPKEAWFHMGRGFAGLGFGTMYAFTPNMGVILELRAQEMFPTSGQSFGGQLAYAVGF